MPFYVCPIERGEKQIPDAAFDTFAEAVDYGRNDISDAFVIENERGDDVAYHASIESVIRIVRPAEVPANWQPGMAGGYGLRPLLDPAQMPGWEELEARMRTLPLYRDSSYRNDVSPSRVFVVGGVPYQLFIAPASVLARSPDEPHRFMLLTFAGEYGLPEDAIEDGELDDVVLETDDPLEVLAWIDQHNVPLDPAIERARRLELGPSRGAKQSDRMRESDPLVQRAKLLEMNPPARRNPASEHDDVVAAKKKFEEFHQKAPRKIFEGQKSPIPTRVSDLGKAKYVLYRSDKKNPETGRQEKRPVDYIHEHDAGVRCYAPDGAGDVEVPAFIRDCRAFVLLGKCLGFGIVDDEGEREAKASSPLPDLYATPCGRALIVLQDRREVLALVWGGALGVEARGIVG